MGSVPCSAVRCFRNSVLISAYGSFVLDWPSICTLCCSQVQSDVVLLGVGMGSDNKNKKSSKSNSNSKSNSYRSK